MLQVLTGVSPLLSARIVFDYLTATIRSTFAPAKKEHSFEEWGVRNLGRTLYDLCFGLYSARVWGLPTSQISSKQAQRVAKLNLKNIVLRTLGIKADPATYFTKYMYPRQGISVLFENMATAVCRSGNHIFLESPVVRLERDGDRIARAVYSRDGREQTMECDGVLSTLPLPALVNMIAPRCRPPWRNTPRSCRYRSLS